MIKTCLYSQFTIFSSPRAMKSSLSTAINSQSSMQQTVALRLHYNGLQATIFRLTFDFKKKLSHYFCLIIFNPNFVTKAISPKEAPLRRIIGSC